MSKLVKNVFLTTILLLFSFCTVTKFSSKNEQQDLKVNTSKTDTFEIENFNQLRLVNIKSAIDSQKLMYLDFGMWDESRIGLHQKNISQKIWKNIDLFKNGKTYTIIADGTETQEEYFTSFIIYDSDTNDCLKIGYPIREEIITYFQNKMKSIESINFDYSILKKRIKH
jgi:hypothetical protein